MIYTKEEFKKKWENPNNEITFDDCADCAQAWGLVQKPRCCRPDTILYMVLKAAECSDAEEYCPSDDEDEY